MNHSEMIYGRSQPASTKVKIIPRNDACRFSIQDNALGQRDNWNAVRGWECGVAAPILNHGEATSQSQSYVERSSTRETLLPRRSLDSRSPLKKY